MEQPTPPADFLPAPTPRSSALQRQSNCPVVTKQAGAGGVTRTWMPMARLRPDCDYVHPNAALVTSCWCD